jgi:predicted RNA-binding protein YlqC (UPF0109 family)
LEELVTYIARALVDRPEQVEVRASEVDGATLYELKVAADDVGKVIGRDGRTVNAVRTLLAAAAAQKGGRARLEVLDDRKTAGAASAEPAPAEPPGQ